MTPTASPPKGPDGRARQRRVALATAAAALFAVTLVLVGMEIDRSETVAAGRNNLAALWPWWISSGLAWLALTAVWWTLRDDPQEVSRRGTITAVVTVLLVAAAARVVVVVAHEPQLSDDCYRYLLDGHHLAGGRNPYLIRPEEVTDPPAATLASMVNNPELHTIYLPASQWVFAGLAFLAGPPDDVSQGVRVVRGGLVAFELIAIGLLLAALLSAGRSPWLAVLYAWHPLALTEIAGAGHQDAIGLPVLLAALLLATVVPRRVWHWTVALACASLVKPIVTPVALFLLRGRPLRCWIASVFIGVVVCLVISWPLLLVSDLDPLVNLWETANRFRLKWAHFGPVYEPVLWLIEVVTPAWGNDAQEILARRLCTLVLAVVFVVIARNRSADAWHRTGVLFLAMVLLSPAAHPWYLLWALILVPWCRNPTVWMLSLTIGWGYAVLGDVEQWTLSPWIMVLAYAPVWAVWVASIVGARRSCSRLRAIDP